MNKLTALVVSRPVLVIVFCLFTALVGTISVGRLTRQEYPNVDLPAIAVSVNYPGASTSEMRDAVVAPIENKIAGTPNLDHISTNVQNGHAAISAVFVLGSDQTQNLAYVQKALQEAQSQLPSDLPAPVITSSTLSASTVVSLVATSKTLDEGALSALVDNKIAPRISQLPGVSSVVINGDVQPAIRVDVDPGQLSARNQTLDNLIATIANNNLRAPGGYATEGSRETSIDVRGDVVSPDTVAGLVLGGSPSAPTMFGVSPALVPVSSVAHVYEGSEPAQTYAFIDGQRAIALDVKKASDASEVGVSNAVIAALPQIEKQLGAISLRVVSVQSSYSKRQIEGAVRSLGEAIVCTAILMLFFLRSWRHAVVVCISIPTSLFVTFTVMAFAGFSIDTVSLGAMTLVIGILVDDSTVVLENIERHHHDLGEDARTAAIAGRSEIALAAITLTLVDVAVFLPIAFLPGVIGKLLFEFGAVVVVSTLTSLFIGFTVTPALAGRWSLLETWRPFRAIDVFSDRFDELRSFYAQRMLPWGLAHGRLIAIVSAASLTVALALVPAGVIGMEFVPPDDRGELFVQVTLPSGTSLDATRDSTLQLMHEFSSIADMRTDVGLAGAYQASFGGVVQQRNILQLHVFLRDGRKHSTSYWSTELTKLAQAQYPDASVVAIPATGMNGGPAQPIDDQIVLADGADPTAVGLVVANAFRHARGAAMVTTSAAVPAPQVAVQFDRDRARALDVNIGAASSAIRAAFGGYRATQYENELGLNYVQVIYPTQLRNALPELMQIPLTAQNGATVYAGDFAHFSDDPTPPLLTRVNRTQTVDVSANAADGYELSNVARSINKQIAALHLPQGVIVAPSPSGNQQNLKDLIKGICVSLVLSTAIVYLLMVALYNGFRTPLIIMFSVPVAVTGAFTFLALFHQTLNLFSMIGLVLLIGLVVKNGILLVDFADQLRERGREKIDAIVESATLRFRPIVMTTTAMVVGMMPIAIALDPGTANRRSLGLVVIGGLTSSLILTLVLVPVVYMWLSPPDRRQSMQLGGQS